MKYNEDKDISMQNNSISEIKIEESNGSDDYVTSTTSSNEDAINKYVGLRLKTRRVELGITQQNLAKSLNISFQQVQKYENGKNKLSANMMFELCKILNVNFSYFYDGFDDFCAVLRENESDYEVENNSSKNETVSLLRAFYGIKSQQIRKQCIDIVRTMAASQNKDESE